MKKQQNLEMDTITYSFADGTKQVQPINKEIFIADHKGRKRSHNEVIDILRQNGIDRGAISHIIDADTDTSDSIVIEKETFTSQERYNAKRDHREFKANNPEVYHKERAKLINQLSDGLAKRLRFNLTNLSFLN